MYLIWRLLSWPIRFVGRNARALFAALLGYGIIGAAGAGALAASVNVAGGEWLLEPNSWEVSGGWIITTMAAAAAGALVGGLVCHKIDRSGTGTRFLLAFLVLVGLATILVEGGGAAEVPREGIPDMAGMRSGAVEPAWAAGAKSVLAVVCVFVGAKWAGRHEEMPPAQEDMDTEP